MDSLMGDEVPLAGMPPGVNGIRKILIMELWGIGDVVMMSAILPSLRAAFPEAQICALVQEHGREVLQENTEIDRFFVFRFPWTAFRGKYLLWRWDWKGLFQLITTLRREQFDLVLDARADPRNDALLILMGGHRFRGWHKPQNLKHRIEHWHSLLRYWGIPGKDLRPVIVLSDEERLSASEFLENKLANRPAILVGVHPGAAQRIRCWPMDGFQQIVSWLRSQPGIGVLVFVEPSGYGTELAASLGLPYFRGDLRQLAAVISQLDLLLCNDTGAMHISTAVGTQVVAIFGPGDPAFIGPLSEAEVVIKPCAHRPCFDSCYHEKAECLERIAVEEVWEAVLRRLNFISSRVV
jgi:ADP-heptose:LPS heptosyltransferase